MRVVSPGDNSVVGADSWLSSGPSTDVIIAACWNGITNTVSHCMENPRFNRNTALFLPSHFNELSHRVQQRESYMELYTRKDRMAAEGVIWPRAQVLYYGDGILWKRKL